MILSDSVHMKVKDQVKIFFRMILVTFKDLYRQPNGASLVRAL